MWWLSELGWAGLEDGLGWPPCRFVPGFWSGPRMCGVEGWVGWRTAVLFGLVVLDGRGVRGIV